MLRKAAFSSQHRPRPRGCGVVIGRRALALGDGDGVEAGLGVERGFAAAGPAKGLVDAGELFVVEAGDARGLRWSDMTFPTACAQAPF